MSEALVYYFAFPHYRRGILEGLRAQPEPAFDLVAGSSSRANIKALGEGDIEGLQIVPSFRLGPVSWDRGVVARAIAPHYSTVVLGPATLSLSTWAILIGRRLRGRKTFLWGQCGRFGDRSLKRRVQEVMNRLATGLLVYGENEAVAATQMGLAPHRVTVINNATHSNRDVLDADDSDQQLARAQEAAELAKREGRLNLLFVGRLNNDKHLDVLLSAAARLKEQYPGLTLDLIGDGDAREDLRARFDEEWVKFHGWVYDTDELAEYFRRATFVCSPFHMGLLAIDSLRAGTPVLIPDNPMNGSEVEALTPMVNAVRFSPGEEQGIVDAVEQWFSVVGDLDPHVYREARTTALATWDPEGVAAAVKRATAKYRRRDAVATMGGQESRRTPTFLWLTGHVRNVGDSMLRRPLADLYRDFGPISVWSGAPESGYAAGLRISPAESARSFRSWAWQFTKSAVRGRPTFVFNAGEFGVTKAYFFGLLILAPALTLARIKGSRIVWAGAGVKNRRRYFMWPFDALAKAAADLRWRDVTSANLMGRGQMMPDWGFGIGPGGGSEPASAEIDPASRRKIAVSLRGDRREPSEEWLDAVVRLAERLDRDIVCVVQVEDDDALARRIAGRLGAEVVGWGDGDHWTQEQRVRDVYAQSVVALSDRLHGLVIAATEGAVPLGWCEATTKKVADHFKVIGADWVGPEESSVIALIDALDARRIDELSVETAARIVDARARVDAVREELASAEER